MKLPTDPPTQKTVVVHHPDQPTNQNQALDPNQPGCSSTNQNSETQPTANQSPEPSANQNQPEIQLTNQNSDPPVANQKTDPPPVTNQKTDPPLVANQNADTSPLPQVTQIQPFLAVNPLGPNAAPIETGTGASREYIHVGPPPFGQPHVSSQPVISQDDIDDLAECNQFNSTPHGSQDKNTGLSLSPIQQVSIDVLISIYQTINMI